MTEGQWYPGNMARATAQLREDLKIVDLVVELLDARIPYSSRNPALGKLIGQKKHLLLLHKADRSDEEGTQKWLNYFKAAGLEAMAFSVQHKQYLKRLLAYLDKEDQNIRRGRLKRPLRMIIVGIPNVGKSTMINYFVRKSVVKTGNQPGITRGRQWIRINPTLELLDTPGILWPRINEDTAWSLAVVGAIPPSRIDRQNLAIGLLDYYRRTGNSGLITGRYDGVKGKSSEETLEIIGLNNGCLISEGRVDLDRAASLVLRDFQAGLLGRVTLEYPEKPEV